MPSVSRHVISAAAAALVISLPSSFVCADGPRPAKLRPARLASAELRRAHSDLAPSLQALRSAVPRTERVDGYASSVSRTYVEEVWSTGARPTNLDVRLGRVMRASLRPDPRDFVWYEDAKAFARPTVESIAASFTIGYEREPTRAEAPAVRALAERVLAFVAAHPRVTLVSARCGWGDVTGGAYHGVMLFDAATNEAIWLHLDESWSEDA